MCGHEPAPARTYEVRTYGCQMNVHDSERLTGLLEDAGYVAAPGGRPRRRGRVQHLRGAGERRQQALRQPRPPRVGEEEAAGHADRRRWLPGAEGPLDDHREGARGSTSSSAPTTSARCRCCSSGPGCRRRRRSRSSSRSRCSPRRCRPGASRRTPPGCRSRSGATTPARSASCPALRGKEKDRRPGEILAEIEALVAEGVTEVTLLGQNVNAYGVEFGDRQAFSKLLRACGDDRGPRAGAVHLAAPARSSPTT